MLPEEEDGLQMYQALQKTDRKNLVASPTTYCIFANLVVKWT